MLYDLIRVIVPAAAAFAVGILCTPVLTHYLYHYKAWKKKSGKRALDGSSAEEFNKLHITHEVRAPRMGGIVVWGSVTLTIIGISIATVFSPYVDMLQLDFLSRNQTWLPLAALLGGAFIGLLDDLLMIQPDAEGLPLRLRLLFVLILSSFIGWWFWDKLDVTTINIPFGAPLEVGIMIIPIFMLVSLALYASGVIDGIDGLSGGVFASIFASYSIIAFAQQQIDLAAFSAAIVGGLLAFLWFNVPPARFYMTDTGTMGLTLALGVVAFMTDSLGGGVGISVLPIIGMLLVVTVLSDVAQVLSKRFLGRKVLRIAPLHHHFEAVGWSGAKVVMRYWILSIVFAFCGVLIALSAVYVSGGMSAMLL
jgi:phospho-N-acetylmuramoyl-pentapeptide-transferase